MYNVDMLVITGPTSSGKTSLAFKLCQQFNGEIVSADSRQIYKHFDVGTGKLPTNTKDYTIEIYENFWKISGINIWMYDTSEPDKIYSASEFKLLAASIIKGIKGRGKMPIVVGGTGLYIDALLGLPVVSEIEPDWNLRAELENKSVIELIEMLPEDIKAEMNESDIKNPRRLIRRIELMKSGGAKYVEEKAEDPESQPYDFSDVIVINRPREELYKRADLWVVDIWSELLKETKGLLDMGYENAIPMQGIIYKTVKDYLNGVIKSEDEAKQTVKYDLHHYIRRQETWFRKYRQPDDTSAKFLDPANPNFDASVVKIVELHQHHEKSK